MGTLGPYGRLTIHLRRPQQTIVFKVDNDIHTEWHRVDYSLEPFWVRTFAFHEVHSTLVFWPGRVLSVEVEER